MFVARETPTSLPNKMAIRKRNLLVVAMCLVTLSHMLAYASSPSAKIEAIVGKSNDQNVEESKKAVKYVAVEVKEADQGGKMSTELMLPTPKMELSPPMSSKLSGTELMMVPKMGMEMEIMEPVKSMKAMSPKEVNMMVVPMVKVKDQSEDLTEAAGHKKYVLVKKKPKMKKIKMEVYKPKMKYKKIKMKVPVKKMKKKKVKGYMVKKHHEHY